MSDTVQVRLERIRESLALIVASSIADPDELESGGVYPDTLLEAVRHQAQAALEEAFWVLENMPKDVLEQPAPTEDERDDVRREQAGVR